MNKHAKTVAPMAAFRKADRFLEDRLTPYAEARRDLLKEWIMAFTSDLYTVLGRYVKEVPVSKIARGGVLKPVCKPRKSGMQACVSQSQKKEAIHPVHLSCSRLPNQPISNILAVFAVHLTELRQK